MKTHSQTQNVFAELAYTGLKGEHFALEPYAGVSYMHIKNKGVTKGEVQLKDNNRDLIVTSRRFIVHPIPFVNWWRSIKSIR